MHKTEKWNRIMDDYYANVTDAQFIMDSARAGILFESKNGNPPIYVTCAGEDVQLLYVGTDFSVADVMRQSRYGSWIEVWMDGVRVEN